MILSSVNADDRSYGGERLSSQLSTLSLLFHQLIFDIIMRCQHIFFTIIIIIVFIGTMIAVVFTLMQALGRSGQLFATVADEFWFKFGWIQCRECVGGLFIAIGKVEWCRRFETIVGWWVCVWQLCSRGGVGWTVLAGGGRWCFTVLLCVVINIVLYCV